MAKMVAHQTHQTEAEVVARHLHRFVTYGPWDLDVAWAMSGHGYDEAKWAEGQGVLAELVTAELSVERSLVTAIGWYEEAAAVARQVLAKEPQLLAKLGVT
jgi:hypothetical protein